MFHTHTHQTHINIYNNHYNWLYLINTQYLHLFDHKIAPHLAPGLHHLAEKPAEKCHSLRCVKRARLAVHRRARRWTPRHRLRAPGDCEMIFCKKWWGCWCLLMVIELLMVIGGCEWLVVVHDPNPTNPTSSDLLWIQHRHFELGIDFPGTSFCCTITCTGPFLCVYTTGLKLFDVFLCFSHMHKYLKQWL